MTLIGPLATRSHRGGHSTSSAVRSCPARTRRGSCRASGPEQGGGHRASLGIYHISKTCAVAAPHVTASVRETDQQWAMLKLFGAAATFGVVLR